MAPQPKRKLSRGRQHRRRSHFALGRPHLVACPKCHAMQLPHHICPSCGNYDGKTVVEMKTKEKKTTNE
jgi:large subunit ribosomal protein L32